MRPQSYIWLLMIGILTLIYWSGGFDNLNLTDGIFMIITFICIVGYRVELIYGDIFGRIGNITRIEKVMESSDSGCKCEK